MAALDGVGVLKLRCGRPLQLSMFWLDARVVQRVLVVLLVFLIKRELKSALKVLFAGHSGRSTHPFLTVRQSTGEAAFRCLRGTLHSA